MNGQLQSYQMGPGLARWPIFVGIVQNGYRIVVHANINRLSTDRDDLEPYFKRYMGQDIGVKVSPTTYYISELKFGDKEFEIKPLED